MQSGSAADAYTPLFPFSAKERRERADLAEKFVLMKVSIKEERERSDIKLQQSSSLRRLLQVSPHYTMVQRLVD